MFSFLLIKHQEIVLYQKTLKEIPNEIMKVIKKGKMEYYQDLYLISHQESCIEYVLGVQDPIDIEIGYFFVHKLHQELSDIWKPLNPAIFLLEIDKIARVIDDSMFSL